MAFLKHKAYGIEMIFSGAWISLNDRCHSVGHGCVWMRCQRLLRCLLRRKALEVGTTLNRIVHKPVPFAFLQMKHLNAFHSEMCQDSLVVHCCQDFTPCASCCAKFRQVRQLTRRCILQGIKAEITETDMTIGDMTDMSHGGTMGYPFIIHVEFFLNHPAIGVP